MTNTFKATRRGVVAAAVLLVLAGCGGNDGQRSTLPPGRESFAYVSNASPDTVSVHNVDGDTGSVGGVAAAAPAGASPLSVAVHPSGKFLYVANFLSFDISEYRIDPVDGTLTLIRPPVSTGAGLNPLFVSVHPSGRFALVATLLDHAVPGKVTPYGIDAATGTLTRLGAGVFAGNGPNSIAIAPAGSFAYVADFASDVVWTLAIETNTGTLTNIAPDQPALAGAFPASIAVDGRGGFAYVANTGSNDVWTYAIDPAAGGLTPVGAPVAAGAEPTSVAIHPSGKFAYVANAGSDDISVYTIDALSGALSAQGAAVAAGDRPRSITLDPAGRFAYVVNVLSSDISVYAIDAASGALRSVGDRVATGQQPTAMALVARPH